MAICFLFCHCDVLDVKAASKILVDTKRLSPFIIVDMADDGSNTG
jgi:hypothetical protein